MTLELTRRRALALEEATQRLDDGFGHLVNVLLRDEGPRLRLRDVIPHGYPDDTLANDVVLGPWEVLLLLRGWRDRYASEVLAPAERVTT